MAPEPPSPSASSVLLPFLVTTSRRASLASIASTRNEPTKASLAQALDDIHISASKSEGLTSFHDFDGSGPRAATKERIGTGINGFFDKVKRSWVSVPGEVKEDGTNKQPTALPTSAGNSHPKLETGPKTVVRKGSRSLRNPLPVTSSGSQPFKHPNVPRARSKLVPVTSDRANVQYPALEETPPGLTSSQLSLDELVHPRDLTDGKQANEHLALPRFESPVVSDTGGVGAHLSHGHVDFSKDVIIPQSPDKDSETPSASVAGPALSLIIRDEDDSDRAHPRSRSPLTQDGMSSLPGYQLSRASSVVRDTDAASLDSTENEVGLLHIGVVRKSRDDATSGPKMSCAAVPQHLKRRVVSKAFWMKDENAKDCFSCGQSFSTFRRKHHCRTCGQIFDAKCTTLVPGKPFGQPSSLRLCRPCESMVFGSDDDTSLFTDDVEVASNPRLKRSYLRQSMTENDGLRKASDDASEISGIATPSIGIPVSRRNREAKQRSDILEFNGIPKLIRPSSSHSLISLARRPQSTSHRRHNSRHYFSRSKTVAGDDQGPFQSTLLNDRRRLPSTPAAHETFIDPDLAPFASDEGSEYDAQTNLLSSVGGVLGLPFNGKEDSASGGQLNTPRKNRLRPSTTSNGRELNEVDTLSQLGKHHAKPPRKRNASFSNVAFGRPTPWRNRSTNLLKSAPELKMEQSIIPGEHSTMPSPSTKGEQSPLLPQACTEHIRGLLRQILHDSKIAEVSAWEMALIPIISRCAVNVEPNVRLGDDMDIRDYIKIKKIPGGRPRDATYVSGIVFTKNIALKSMARSIDNPRIAIVTFAIEYARHETHFMSLEPVIAQEQEYLRNLVGRIAALRPHVLLVQQNVAGLALDLLEDAGITVACNIKESVLAAVARMTQTTVIKSVDKLAIDSSHLGQCENFEIKTYAHHGRRKTYIFISGCAQDLGCTILLRGSDIKALQRLKRITEFLCYVAYNLTLETSLMRDEHIVDALDPVKHFEPQDLKRCEKLSGSVPTTPDLGKGKTPTTVEVQRGDDLLPQAGALEAQAQSRVLSASPFVVFMQPYILTQLREAEHQLTTFETLRDQYAAADETESKDASEAVDRRFEIVRPEMVHTPPSSQQPRALREYLHAVHQAQFEKTQRTYDSRKRVFDSFMSSHIDPFDPFSHQTIVVLHSTISTLNSAPCVGPELLHISFYAGLNHAEHDFEEDCSLGHFVEDCCLSAKTTCKDCGKQMMDHHRQYVHGYGQISISVRLHNGRSRGHNKAISMWAACRLCQKETNPVPMSANTWKYSFAKYLELSFWSTPLHVGPDVCEHDAHKDFVRCFAFENRIMRVQYDGVQIYDIVVPRPVISWKVEADLKTKNEQFLRFSSRLDAFTESIRKRLDSINVDTLDEKEAENAHEYLDELRARARRDHQDLLERLQDRYANSRYYELIPLNSALRFMDQKALEWDEVFTSFERDYFPSETDIRKLATLQLRNMFLESQPTNIPLDEAGDGTERSTEMTAFPIGLRHQFDDTELHSEKAHDVLESTLEEHRSFLDTDTSNDASQDRLSRDLQREARQLQNIHSAESMTVEQDHSVEHLDLAITAKSPDSNTLIDDSNTRSGTESSRGWHDTLSTGADASRLMPHSPNGLLDRVEQIREEEVQGREHEPPGSKIPRLSGPKKASDEIRPHPPLLLRTRSQPNHGGEREVDAKPNNNHTLGSGRGKPHTNERKIGLGRFANKVGKVAPSLIPRSITTNRLDAGVTSVSALAEHFEQMSREFERKRLMERRQRALWSRQARANPHASSQPVVEVYHNATEAVGDRQQEFTTPQLSDQRTSVLQHDHANKIAAGEAIKGNSHDLTDTDMDAVQNDDAIETEVDPSSQGTTTERMCNQAETTSDIGSSTVLSSVDSQTPGPAYEVPIPEHKKNVWLKYLAEFWSKRSASGWANLEYPLRTGEHVFEDSDIIVREDEPSSVIALSLACPDYLSKVEHFRTVQIPTKNGNGEAKPNSAKIDPGISYSGRSADEEGIEASLLGSTGTHMKYSFSHGQVKASCKIFYAEAFDALRRKCGAAERFIESLSRCLKYDSKGGKTKSLFLKTLDNRFIVKSLQEVELKAFTKFAPDYFAFMGHTLFHGVPSVIAKMLGLFQVIIKNPATGVDFSYYLLVMENLFYEQTPNRRFDLKGSMRNRKVESTGQPDEVLLDENLVETIFESPLLVREHSRKLLQASVWNDTMWLCRQNVMDYSLMAGFDDERKELVVGIIDCIRTYTWDKKLESWIKDRGKNKPTITSPKDYRNRFRVSMMQYMLVAPTVWHQFQAQMAPPKTLKERDEDASSFRQEHRE